MQPRHRTTLRGSWTTGKIVWQTDDMGGGRVTSIVGERIITFRQPRPGLHPLYYSVLGGQVHWDEQQFALHRKMRALGQTKPKVVEVCGGDTVVFDGRTLSHRSSPIVLPPMADHHVIPQTMYEAQNDFRDILDAATGAIYDGHQRGPVTMLLSGGVDSIAILHALKENGADVHAVTAGMTEDEFDPYWARKTAEYLGVPWSFIHVPSQTDELQKVLVKTLGIIEQTSFSNVLMGVCCTLIQEWMVQNERPVAYLGFWGDLLFGHKLQVTGSFNALPEPAQTDEAWSHQRIEHCWHSKPHTLQLAKGFRHGGNTTWRAPFTDDMVASYAFNLSREFAPPKMDKPLLYGMTDLILPKSIAAWHVTKKIGFYTGAGIGKERLRNPVLQDPNIRATFQRVKAALS